MMVLKNLNDKYLSMKNLKNPEMKVYYRERFQQCSKKVCLNNDLQSRFYNFQWKTLKTLKWKSITENVFSSVQREIVWTMIYKADSATTTANEAT